jgi:hypothetical protein
MPTPMDVHSFGRDWSLAYVAESLKADLAIRAKHGVEHMRGWVYDKAGKILCLVDAPDAETAAAVHMEAHGRAPDEMFEVTEGDR